jgi:hypothetical protein
VAGKIGGRHGTVFPGGFDGWGVGIPSWGTKGKGRVGAPGGGSLGAVLGAVPVVAGDQGGVGFQRVLLGVCVCVVVDFG